MLGLGEIACKLNSLGVASVEGRGMDAVTDQAVVKRVIDGDLDAFSVLVDRYQGRINSVVFNYVLNREDAVDVVQDTFVKAYTKLRTFDSASAFYTWLYRIAVNTSIDFLRKRRARPTDSLDDDKYTDAGYEPVSRDPAIDPERVAIASEQGVALRRAIALLSEKLRTVVILHDVEGLSQEEVADVLKVPVGTVKSRVSRARAELRYSLAKQLGEAS